MRSFLRFLALHSRWDILLTLLPAFPHISYLYFHYIVACISSYILPVFPYVLLSRIPASTSYASTGDQGLKMVSWYWWGWWWWWQSQWWWWLNYDNDDDDNYVLEFLWSRLQSCGAHDQFDDKTLTCVRFQLIFVFQKYLKELCEKITNAIFQKCVYQLCKLILNTIVPYLYVNSKFIMYTYR